MRSKAVLPDSRTHSLYITSFKHRKKIGFFGLKNVICIQIKAPFGHHQIYMTPSCTVHIPESRLKTILKSPWTVIFIKKKSEHGDTRILAFLSNMHSRTLRSVAILYPLVRRGAYIDIKVHIIGQRTKENL